MSTDRISNLLSSLKNAAMAGKGSIETPYFKQGKEILDVLKTRKLINEVKVFKQEDSTHKGIHVDLVSRENGLVRRMELVRISKPGHRVYGPYKDFQKVKAGLGVLVVSTSRGVMTGEEAKKKKLGGEMLCKVYFE